jgi:hypothetical protein
MSLAQARLARCVSGAARAGCLDNLAQGDRDRAHLLLGVFCGFAVRPPPATVLPQVNAVARAVLELMRRAEADGWVTSRTPRWAASWACRAQFHLASKQAGAVAHALIRTEQPVRQASCTHRPSDVQKCRRRMLLPTGPPPTSKTWRTASPSWAGAPSVSLAERPAPPRLSCTRCAASVAIPPRCTAALHCKHCALTQLAAVCMIKGGILIGCMGPLDWTVSHMAAVTPMTKPHA